MKIFTIIGAVFDMLLNCEMSIVSVDGDVLADFNDTDLILPLCDIEGTWSKSTLVFTKDKRNGRGALDKIVLYDEEDNERVCEVGKTICSELSPLDMDEAYYKMCEYILSHC